MSKVVPGHISVSCLQTRFSCNAEMLISHYMRTAIIGFASGRVNIGGKIMNISIYYVPKQY